MSNIDIYLSKFGDIAKLDRNILLTEMDNAWTELGLDNRKKIVTQLDQIIQFYTHPVWTLNGIFSELDPTSRLHRELIAKFIAKITHSSIADLGGGSGVLARIIAQQCPASQIDIIEPFPSETHIKNSAAYSNIHFQKKLDKLYDVTIAQDVLEHVDNPVTLGLELIAATKMDGYVIFANSFYPEIKCHLPSSFYLRHTFRHLVKYAGLTFIKALEGAAHVHIFKRTGFMQPKKLCLAVTCAKLIGPFLNFTHPTFSKIRRSLNCHEN